MSSLPFHMPDLKVNRRAEEPDPDREALEHIARALESRRFQRPEDGASRNESEEASEFFLAPQSLKALLEGMPVAVAILSRGVLADANSAFANAFGYPSAAAAAESLCRIIEHAPDLAAVPDQLIAHHINAVQAIVRNRTKLDTAVVAGVLSKQLRGIADEFLTHANRDRPEHLEAILAPSIVPGE